MKTVYQVTGSEDGVIGIFSSWKKATARAYQYVGETCAEDLPTDTDDLHRSYVRFFYQSIHTDEHGLIHRDGTSATVELWEVK